MATEIITNKAGWLTVQQAAEYLGVSVRGLKYAVQLKKTKKANNSLILKQYGNRTLINKDSIDLTETIVINLK